MHVALPIVLLVILAATVAGLAERFGRSAPLLLVIVGVAVSFVPGVKPLRLDPEVVLFGFLPPLLYAAAIRTSLVDFRANRRAILLLSVGCVVFSTGVVGVVAWWAIPSLSWAAAFAIGAVVAPPDAVAATAVGRKVGMPRRMVTILEGESLVNDATALVALNTAIGAVSSNLSVPRVGLDFVIPCVDFMATITPVNSTVTRVAVADCQRMVWRGDRWWIGAGREPASPPSIWPGSRASYEAGYQWLAVSP